jgi:histone deacetylase complex regulatory component SIN3
MAQPRLDFRISECSNLRGEIDIQQNYVSITHSGCIKRKLWVNGEDEADARQRKARKAQNFRPLIDKWQERLKPCSGRDDMCKSVLNDAWASHPTWASEDSGFVAHRKNVFEEGLHRIEEERHDYDFNIEANAKVIQLLEPIGQSILAMTPAEREDFRIPPGLGGQSRSVYNRVFKKIYSDRGPGVVADLFKDPCAVLPVVLPRLKQKDEEWRTTQVTILEFPSCALH